MQKTRHSRLNLKVADLLDVKPVDQIFLTIGTFTVTLDYPLNKEYKFEVKGPLNAYDLCIHIVKEYQKIYKENEQGGKWGIWGHSIDDLYIEGLRVNYEKKTVRIDMGS